MKYNVVITLGGSVSNYDGMTGEPIDLDQTGCPTEILGTFETEDEARDFLEDCVWGRTNLPQTHKKCNMGFRIEPVNSY